ncbi:hypothetical protein L228DRAFT_247614 [Xylona heveae TC161]|uniref:Uncharacterized protein n=1 Tax=Xylona heveae (strain CBS 132557 / TC161) TaxID=1328760 RepID=A0A165GBX8_XYLHT|nr:hypothetical protein L228DRAFT_247614 [Xylona heveae TC161]KZF22003.1 hypothetical protein L228DRAFT_247614 [Xylona heveae TC161]
MPAQDDKTFYSYLDSIAQTTKGEDAVSQNKRIKEAEFAEDSREPNEQEILQIKQALQRERDMEHHNHQPSKPTSS